MCPPFLLGNLLEQIPVQGLSAPVTVSLKLPVQRQMTSGTNGVFRGPILQSCVDFTHFHGDAVVQRFISGSKQQFIRRFTCTHAEFLQSQDAGIAVPAYDLVHEPARDVALGG